MLLWIKQRQKKEAISRQITKAYTDLVNMEEPMGPYVTSTEASSVRLQVYLPGRP